MHLIFIFPFLAISDLFFLLLTDFRSGALRRQSLLASKHIRLVHPAEKPEPTPLTSPSSRWTSKSLRLRGSHVDRRIVGTVASRKICVLFELS
jgi:hypothetical protein